MKNYLSMFLGLIFCLITFTVSEAQTPPSASEIENFNPFHKAVFDGDIPSVIKYIQSDIDLESRDQFHRTAIHIATYQSEDEILKLLVEAGAEINAFEADEYDAVTIAAVADDLDILQLILKLGGNPKNTTSPYEGTALIAAAHLGHVEVVRTLLLAGSNIDHVNNLGWTALLEAVILGDGGLRHITIVKDLLDHGADKFIADRRGSTPLMHAQKYNYQEMIELLK